MRHSAGLRLLGADVSAQDVYAPPIMRRDFYATGLLGTKDEKNFIFFQKNIFQKKKFISKRSIFSKKKFISEKKIYLKKNFFV